MLGMPVFERARCVLWMGRFLRLACGEAWAFFGRVGAGWRRSRGAGPRQCSLCHAALSIHRPCRRAWGRQDLAPALFLWSSLALCVPWVNGVRTLLVVLEGGWGPRYSVLSCYPADLATHRHASRLRCFDRLSRRFAGVAGSVIHRSARRLEGRHRKPRRAGGRAEGVASVAGNAARYQ